MKDFDRSQPRRKDDHSFFEMSGKQGRDYSKSDVSLVIAKTRADEKLRNSKTDSEKVFIVLFSGYYDTTRV